MTDDSIQQSNQLLGEHSLAAVRLLSLDATLLLRVEVFHLEWPGVVFGELQFSDVSYVQMPSQTSWGYQLRVTAEADLPSRGDIDSGEIVFEFFTPDGAEPSAYVVAHGVECSVFKT